MPSLALATGAGAGEGLESVLKRMLLEEQNARLKSSTDEVARHNKAEEGLRGQEIAATTSLRADAERDRRDTAATTAADRQERLIQQRVGLRPIGAPVTTKEFGEETGSGGITLGNYTFGSPGKVPLATGDKAKDDAALGTLPMVEWKGTQGQIQAKETADRAAAPKDTNDQMKPMLVDGVVTDVWADPRTHKLSTADGRDVTNTAKHYEAPPSNTFIDTAGGVQRVPTKGGGAATPVLDAKGNPVERETTQTRAMREGAKKLMPLPDRIQQLADQLPDELFGVIGSRLRELGGKVGSVEEFESILNSPQAAQGLDPKAARFMTLLGLLASGVGRVHGGARGGGSIQMIDYMKSLLGGIGTRGLLEGRLQGARDILTLYGEGKLPDDSMLGGAQGGVPTVGGQFQGGTVKSVTPVP